MEQASQVLPGSAVRARSWDWVAWVSSPELAASASHITWAWRYLLAHMVFRYFIGWVRQGDEGLFWLACLLAMGTAFTLSFTPVEARWPALSRAIALVAASVEMAAQFPINSNHSWLECVLLGAVAATDTRRAEQRAMLVAVGRWLVIAIMFHSGLQKILHRTYFDGMYLATLANDDGFSALVKVLVGPLEHARLAAALKAGSEGPFALNSSAGVLLSNAVYLSELGVAVLLFFERTRRLGVVAGILVLCSIEVLALEITFGLLMLNLLALYWPDRRRARIAIGSVVAYGGLAVAQAIVGKAWFFI